MGDWQSYSWLAAAAVELFKLEEEEEIMPAIVMADEVEPILAENPQRFCMFPIKYPAVWEMYKKAEASFWTGMPFPSLLQKHV